MDAYSMSCTSLATRDSSRIYQDLKASRLHSLIQLGQSHLSSPTATMEHLFKRGKHLLGSKPHVAIVGAGLAGLRCADVLLQHGFRITILEGRGRIGGRLHQQILKNGHLVDVGANWIHGTDDNPILDLAKQTGTVVGSWDTKAFIYDETGSIFPQKKAEEYSTVLWDIIQDAFHHSNKSCADIDPNLSLLDFFRDQVKVRIPDTEPDYEKKRQIILKLSEMWGAFVGSPIQKQSLKFFWLEECIDGETLFCAGTHKKILELIAKPAVEGASIMFHSIAERIFYRSDQGDDVKVQLRGGQTLSFDEVVVTAPLGWLKRHHAAFEPPLPVQLTKAIDSIGYGCLEKVYISFPKAFWLSPSHGKEEGSEEKDDGDGDGDGYNSDDDDDENIANGHSPKGVQGFVQWLTPTNTAELNPAQCQLQEIVELASIAPEMAHPTLLFYTYGEQSKYVTSTVAKLDSQEEKDRFLCDFFKPYYSRLPNYSETSAACTPVCCLATDWLHDELAGNGSYSNFQVALENGDENIKTMREGLPDRGLWFAGEHTAPYVALGTVTGAYWSGESVGTRIAELYGLPKRSKM